MKKLVFLGGTCNGSTWRDKLIPLLSDRFEAFNPVVPVWTEEAYQEELRVRAIADYCVYVITPKMKGVYSIAEAGVDVARKGNRVIFCVLLNDDGTEFIDEHLKKSLIKTKELVFANNGIICYDVVDIANYLNQTL